VLPEGPSVVHASAPRRQAVAHERIVYLAPDCTDSAVKKRAHTFLRFGHELLSFSFRRDRYNVGSIPEWPNVELGRSTERRLGARVVGVFGAIRTIFQRRDVWRRASLIYARNLDLGLLALIGRTVTRSRAPLVYEVLDIHPLLASTHGRGRLLRWVERRVLKRCRLLVVSSPAFATQYFDRLQAYRGRIFLLENKWPPDGVFGGPRKLDYELTGSPPCWTIGWFGNLRCEASLQMLTELADQLGDRVRIYLRGYASLLPSTALERALAGRTNLVFAGQYNAPNDLPALYQQVHFNWCADFSDGDNSRWLIPNRLYEGGYFGIPAIGIAEHETGKVVQQRGLGLSLAAPYVDNLKAYLVNLQPDDYRRLRGRIESLPVEHFVETNDIAARMSAQICEA
jgi:succinoglycan biosynthesis protein ExoL